MTAQRIIRPNTAFSLSGKQKRPREKAVEHLEFIRTLPCCVCGSRNNIHAAHIRMASIEYGKRETGGGEKASDCWTLPLCAQHHTDGPGHQHSMSESTFWELHKIDPFGLALKLYAATGDEERAEVILRHVR